MAAISISVELSPQSRDSWITPREQLECLVIPQLEELGIDLETLSEKRVQSAVQSILSRSGVSIADSEREGPPSLFDLCVERIIPASPLPSSLTNWYIALERIGALHDKIPPLPEDIRTILEGTCLIYGDPFTVGETHSLYLIPPGSLNELGTRVSAYGREFFQSENHPLKFRHFLDGAREEHANTPNSQPQWVLISNDVLPGSRKQRYEKLVQTFEALSRESSVDYQVPTLREAIGAIFLHKVATNENLYQAENKQNGSRYIYTHVKETTQGWHLVVGGFTPAGLSVDHRFGYGLDHFVAAAVRKL